MEIINNYKTQITTKHSNLFNKNKVSFRCSENPLKLVNSFTSIDSFGNENEKDNKRNSSLISLAFVGGILLAVAGFDLFACHLLDKSSAKQTKKDLAALTAHGEELEKTIKELLEKGLTNPEHLKI